ncbi:FG-GAP-like repeat-containing protein [Psychromarinibacter halotolerans]|uniref:FG-GAP-like repeat-containing protein n=1 Tax=Psychromarinibacter halotolerans TaxID=1775175 RepID=A0ABV7GML4_9RHOB|nr:FG-GAP-like repeat-containing protein [Psychromarinibacter halotolerans]MDF0596641.1 FG-GAP-like repeat-containing protein [Psychromarinibacter halotolerans]
MNQLVAKSNEKRLLFAVLLCVILAFVFWTQSRYPALNEKAMMSGAIQLEDPLGFEAKFPLDPSMGTVERIFLSTLNWINTNKKGMTFGILFASAFLTLFGYLRRRSFRGGFANSFLGLVIGAPLGVCANCAAPIGKGMYAGGVRAETALSAMVASPTLNIIVLTMAFSLLPFYMAAAKIGLSLLVILVAVPLICRALPTEQLQRVAAPDVPGQVEGHAAEYREGFAAAFFEFVKSFAANFWFIVKTTVPLMLMAGFLGAIAGTLLPQDMVMGTSFSVGILVLLALVGTFLPVPISFDVVVAGALLSAGLSQGYVFALMFTLGAASIYSWLIISSTISMRAANLLLAAICALGILGGAASQWYHNWQSDRALEMLLSVERLLLPAAEAQEAAPVVESDSEVRVSSTPFAPPSPAAVTPFTRVEADTVGIDRPLEFSMKDMWPPFWEGRSMSTGDIDRDGDLDLVSASTEAGLYIYLNDGAGGFTRSDDDVSPLADLDVFNAALVDIDNDGWLDLFLATYLDGNFWVRNDNGRFLTDAAHPVANTPDAPLSLSMTFGDVDLDGDLDAVMGNWTAGWYRRIPGEESRNRVVLNDGGVMDGSLYTDLPGLPGETLTILLSDVNLDGAPDLLVGNDFELPDYLYYGDGAGGFTPVTKADGVLPHTTNTTMAIRTADLHNDGVPELYFAQIAGRSSGVSSTLKMQDLDLYCDTIANADARALCDRNMEIKTWYKSGNRFDPTYAANCQALDGDLQAECKAMLVKDLAIQRRDPSLCALIPAERRQEKAYCDLHFKPAELPLQSVFDTTVPQIMRANVLLTLGEGGVYEDTAGPEGLEVGGWSWDVKVGDFDNDGFQDVYIVNGTWVPNEVSPSNLFFRNNGDGTFTEASGPFGLEDYLMTAAAVSFDMDGDGDLDIVSQPVNGPVVVFRNNAQDTKAVTVSLVDGRGNSHGIGTRLTAELEDGTRMTREITVGGGFMSFDAPVAHFGLGEAEALSTLSVRWPDGEVSTIRGPLPAGAAYVVERLGQPVQ